MRAAVIVLALALGACDLEDLQPGDRSGWPATVGGAPDVDRAPLMPEASDAAQPHPEICAPGYIRAIAPDVSTVLCQHIDGQPYTSNPCTRGRPVGDARALVLCQEE